MKSSWLSFAGDNFWLLFGGVWLGVGALFFCLGLFDWTLTVALDERFQHEGQTAQGTVLTKTTTSSSSGFGSHRTTSRSYRITYRFTTAKSQDVESTAQVYSETWDKLAEGGPIDVTYLRDEPLSNRIEGRTDLGSAFAQVIMGGLLGVVGGALFFWHLRRFRRDTRLRREGMIAEGTVLDVTATGTTIYNARQWRIRYRYRDHLGQTREGQSGLLAPDEAATWHPDDKGMVRFDRLQPQENVWIGKA